MSGRPEMVLQSAALLRELMKGRHDTVTLAAAVGRSKQLISYLHSGARTSCSRETARRIAAALGCELDVLFCPPLSDESEERTV